MFQIIKLYLVTTKPKPTAVMPRYLLARIFIYLLPAILLAYVDEKLGFYVFGKDTPQEKKFEGIVFLAGLAISVVYFPLVYETQKKRLNYQSNMISKIFRSFRENLNRDLSTYFKKSDLYLNIRIFLPKRGIRAWLSKFFYDKKYFKMYNFEGLFVDEVKNLDFQVEPTSSGLVGKCYQDNKRDQEKRLWHDFKLKENHNNPTYQLSKSQIQKTDYCSFAIAAPVFKKGNDIDAIITFDSRIPVDDPPDNSWETLIIRSCTLIHLCKPLITGKNFNYEPE